jgi:hypothetical protein
MNAPRAREHILALAANLAMFGLAEMLTRE